MRLRLSRSCGPVRPVRLYGRMRPYLHGSWQGCGPLGRLNSRGRLFPHFLDGGIVFRLRGLAWRGCRLGGLALA